MSIPNVPATSRMERKRENTRQKIIETGMQLFMEQGIEATTMEQIAEQVDIAKGTLYNYFPVKEAIIDAYIKRAVQSRNEERFQRLSKLPDTRTRVITMLTELMQGVQAQREIFEKYFIYRIQKMITLEQDESAESGLGSLEEQIIRLGQQNGDLRTDLSAEILEDLLEFAFIEVAQQLYKDPKHFVAEQVIPQYVDLFLNGAKQQEKLP